MPTQTPDNKKPNSTMPRLTFNDQSIYIGPIDEEKNPKGKGTYKHITNASCYGPIGAWLDFYKNNHLNEDTFNLFQILELCEINNPENDLKSLLESLKPFHQNFSETLVQKCLHLNQSQSLTLDSICESLTQLQPYVSSIKTEKELLSLIRVVSLESTKSTDTTCFSPIKEAKDPVSIYATIKGCPLTEDHLKSLKALAKSSIDRNWNRQSQYDEYTKTLRQKALSNANYEYYQSKGPINIGRINPYFEHYVKNLPQNYKKKWCDSTTPFKIKNISSQRKIHIAIKNKNFENFTDFLRQARDKEPTLFDESLINIIKTIALDTKKSIPSKIIINYGNDKKITKRKTNSNLSLGWHIDKRKNTFVITTRVNSKIKTERTVYSSMNSPFLIDEKPSYIYDKKTLETLSNQPAFGDIMKNMEALHRSPKTEKNRILTVILYDD